MDRIGLLDLYPGASGNWVWVYVELDLQYLMPCYFCSCLLEYVSWSFWEGGEGGRGGLMHGLVEREVVLPSSVCLWCRIAVHGMKS